MTAFSTIAWTRNGQYNNFWYTYYSDNKPLNIGFIPHLTHFVTVVPWEIVKPWRITNRKTYLFFNFVLFYNYRLLKIKYRVLIFQLLWTNAMIGCIQNCNYDNLLTYYLASGIRNKNDDWVLSNTLLVAALTNKVFGIIADKKVLCAVRMLIQITYATLIKNRYVNLTFTTRNCKKVQ